MAVTYDKMSRVLFWGGVSYLLASLTDFLGLISFWTTFLNVWGLSAVACFVLASFKVFPVGKAVLITGCDTGFGNAAALYLDKLGFRVFACCLLAKSGGEGAQMLRRDGSRRLHVLQLDVINQEQIHAALEEVKKLLPVGEVLWAVVNNAGINPYGCVEWLSMNEYRSTAEVNLFGAIAVTKAFLPLIRKAKGRVVNVGSVRGRMACPMGTAYEVTKYGIEAFSDGLRHEMRKFGVHVSLIEPGNFTLGTRIFTEENVRRISKKMWDEMDDEIKGDYGKQYFDDAMQHQLGHTKSGARELTVVLEAIADALTQTYPQSRYQPMDLFYYTMVFVSQHFPEWVYDNLYIEYLLK